MSPLLAKAVPIAVCALVATSLGAGVEAVGRMAGGLAWARRPIPEALVVAMATGTAGAAFSLLLATRIGSVLRTVFLAPFGIAAVAVAGAIAAWIGLHLFERQLLLDLANGLRSAIVRGHPESERMRDHLRVLAERGLVSDERLPD